MLRQTAGGIGAREWLLSLTNLADLDFAIDEEEALAVYDNEPCAAFTTDRLRNAGARAPSSTYLAISSCQVCLSCRRGTVAVRTGEHIWRLTLTADDVDLSREPGPADAVVSGEPSELLLWLWGRRPDTAVHARGRRRAAGRVPRAAAGRHPVASAT